MTTVTGALNTPEARRANAILTIDLSALEDNWKTLDKASGTAQTAAVVKANGYGLDATHAACALNRAGCTTFFVATIDEAIRLRTDLGPQVDIHVLNGFMDGAERDFSNHKLIPVLNALSDIDGWRAYCTGLGKALPCDIHIDTGMSRLGLPGYELETLKNDNERLSHLNIDSILSHMISAEDHAAPQNPQQLAAFRKAIANLPKARASLANSAAIFLGPQYHFDLVRPGVALYGVNPTPGHPNPMRQVVRLQAKILQVRTIDTPQTVGYGATHTAKGCARIATLSTGYADGYLRSLSNTGITYIGEHKAPVVGRVSMDLVTIDVSDVPRDLCHPGALVDLIGPNVPLDDVAQNAGTIGYEILTSLGTRYHRVYIGGNIGD